MVSFVHYHFSIYLCGLLTIILKNMNIGRNAPCPCGSGKKYKKCCLEKDEQERNVQIADTHFNSHFKHEEDEWEPEDEQKSFFDDFSDVPDLLEYVDDEPFDEKEADNKSSETAKLPKISDEEDKLIDIWWEEYKKMDDTEQEREHLVSFINQYPHLTDYLELWHEVLFELGADYFQKDAYEVYVELLLRIRKEFPYTYKESFEYYDSDMIYWFTSQGQLDKIDAFFSLFREYRNESDAIEKLFNAIEFLRATNHSDIILASLTGSKCHEDIRQVIVNNIMEKYLEKPVTDESVLLMANEILIAGDYVSINNDDIKCWKKELLQYIRPFTQWDTNLPTKRTEALNYYVEILNNFAYFLYKRTELSFDSAIYYADILLQYYKEIVSGKKRIADIFCLDENIFINNSLMKKRSWFNFGIEIDSLVQINALYFFADYLKTCGNIAEKQQQDFQEILVKVYQNYYAELKYDGPEMLPFGQFPFIISMQ